MKEINSSGGYTLLNIHHHRCQSLEFVITDHSHFTNYSNKIKGAKYSSNCVKLMGKHVKQ